MNAARILALKRHKPAIKEVGIYYQGFVNNMRLNGKIHDASVVAITRLLTGRLFHDLPLGWKLAVRGRIKPPPLPVHGGGFRKLYRRTLDHDAHTA